MKKELDSAFMAGFDEPEFAGIKLKPFNGIRRYAADCLGLRFFKLHSQAAEDFQKRQTYAGSFDDALMLLWLRVVPDAEVMRCRTRPDEQGEKMWQWAAEMRIEPGNERHQEMVQLCTEVLVEIMEAVAIPAASGKPETTPEEPPPPLPNGPTLSPSSTE